MNFCRFKKTKYSNSYKSYKSNSNLIIANVSSGRAREKSKDEHDETKTIAIYITIEQSLSLNNSLWVVLVAPVNIFNKMDR